MNAKNWNGSFSSNQQRTFWSLISLLHKAHVCPVCFDFKLKYVELELLLSTDKDKSFSWTSTANGEIAHTFPFWIVWTNFAWLLLVSDLTIPTVILTFSSLRKGFKLLKTATFNWNTSPTWIKCGRKTFTKNSLKIVNFLSLAIPRLLDHRQHEIQNHWHKSLWWSWKMLFSTCTHC